MATPLQVKRENFDSILTSVSVNCVSGIVLFQLIGRLIFSEEYQLWSSSLRSSSITSFLEHPQYATVTKYILY